VKAWIALWHREGLWSPPLEEITEGRTYRGHAEACQYFEDLAEFSEEGDSEFPEVRDLGDEVLALGRVWLRFASGVDLDQEAAVLLTWRNGKCVEARAWLSRAEALEAAGLEE
jgi:ketosteroid isomerase-like protein